ncbi:hypothetical protein CDAR_402761 [Caerostris darwini]|uniref:Uncharacterized protein n=1 Tax=Caerostris darwini TaxID=1538125 RepID=A0AAV4N457_9ARAC|nr:hypothetical protein CDAR_402761 [Caerostris darwini]
MKHPPLRTGAQNKWQGPGRPSMGQGGDLLGLISGGEEKPMDGPQDRGGGPLDTRMQRTQTQLALFLGRRMDSYKRMPSKISCDAFFQRELSMLG